ncbi:MAG: TolC family protein [Candidatus Marinimicrobia bacterium]|nr:TolC family protein [Candidatus Neomarinimicrobiota bacterium]
MDQSRDKQKFRRPLSARLGTAPHFTSREAHTPGSYRVRNLWLIGVLAGVISGQSADLERDPIEALFEYNRDIRAAGLALEAAAEKVRIAGVLPDPQVEAATFIEPLQTANGPMEAQLMLGQKFPLWGKLRRQRQVARERVEIARMDLEHKKVMAAFQLRRDWENYLKVTSSLEILDDYRRELESFRSVALTQYSTGTSLTQHPILKLHIEISLVESQINTLESSLAGVENNLQSLLDGHFSPGIFGGQRLALPPIGTDESWLSLARQVHPLYLKAQHDLRIAVLERELATRQNYPDLTAGLTYTAIGDVGTGLSPGADGFGFKAGLNLPLWLGRNRARVKAAELLAGSREETVKAVWNRIEAQVRSTWKDWAESEETFVLYDQQLLQESAQMLASAFSAYETGKISFLDVLDSERMVVRVRLEYQAVEARRRIAGAKLLRDSGMFRLEEESQNED